MSVCHTVETLPGPAASVQVEPWCLHQGGGWPDLLSGSGQCCSQFSAPLITLFCPIDVLTSFLAQVSAVHNFLPHWSQCFAPLMSWPPFWLRLVLLAPLLSWPQFWLRSVLSTVFCPTDHSVLPHWWPDLNSDSGRCYPVFCPIDHGVLPHWCPDLLSGSGQCCLVFCPIDHSVLPNWCPDLSGSGQCCPQCFAPLITMFCPVDDLTAFLALVSSGHSTLLHCFGLLVAYQK